MTDLLYALLALAWLAGVGYVVASWWRENAEITARLKDLERRTDDGH